MYCLHQHSLQDRKHLTIFFKHFCWDISFRTNSKVLLKQVSSIIIAMIKGGMTGPDLPYLVCLRENGGPAHPSASAAAVVAAG